MSLTQESDVTVLKMTEEALKELLNDYREEFYDEEAGFEELQEYMGLEIVISSGWGLNKKFELLKSVEL